MSLEKRVNNIKLTDRQNAIVKLVQEKGPITSEQIAEKLSVTRATLRPDLAILTMIGILDARPKVGYLYANKPSHSIVYEYFNEIKVKDIMSRPIVVSEDLNVYEGIVNLFLNDVGTVFVENGDGHLVGAVSRKDFLKIAMGGSDLHRVPIGIIMTRMPNIIYATKEDNIYDIATRIIDHEIDCLPVVEGEGENLKVVGRVSKTNITKFLVSITKKQEELENK